MTVRETEPGLLLDQLAANVLPQHDITRAQDDTAFLAEASRRLGGSLNVHRALLSTLDIVLPRLADWAMISLFDNRTMRVTVAAASEQRPRCLTVAAPERTDRGLGRVRHTGRREHTTGAFDELVAVPELAAELAALGPDAVVAVPLIARGRTYGAVVMARVAGRYSEADLALADEVAARTALPLDAARVYEERAYIAKTLQRNLRPPSLPDIPGLQLASRYRAAVEHLEIGGDFYDVHGDANDWVAVIGDVCGKGVEAAVLTGRSRQTIQTVTHLDRSPAKILSVLNDVLYEADSDRFVTAVCARLRREPDGGVRVDIASAGHPTPLVLRADGTVETVNAQGVLSGVLTGVEYAEVSVWLTKGDTLLLYTDGIYEARGPEGFYGMRRLLDLLPEYAGTAPEVVCAAVEQSVVEHLCGGPHDDMALLAVTCGDR